MRIADSFYSRGLALAATVAAALAFAQTPTPDKGHQILDLCVAALGGDHFLQMQNRVTAGREYGFFRDQLSGLELFHSYTQYAEPAVATDLGIQERQLLGKKQDYSYLFLPNQGWDITYRGARPVEQEDWSRYVRNTRNDILYILRCRLHESGLQVDYVGTDVLLGRHVEILDITDSTDQAVRVFLDHNTFLPIHETFSWFDEKTREHNDQAYDYDKYRDIGEGIQWPFATERQRNGYKTYQLFADSMQVNQKLPAGIFNLPAGAKVLKRVE